MLCGCYLCPHHAERPLRAGAVSALNGWIHQCHVPAWMGGGFGGEWIHVHVGLSPFAVHLELSQRSLLISHTPILNKKLKVWKKTKKKMNVHSTFLWHTVKEYAVNINIAKIMHNYIKYTRGKTWEIFELAHGHTITQFKILSNGNPLVQASVTRRKWCPSLMYILPNRKWLEALARAAFMPAL